MYLFPEQFPFICTALTIELLNDGVHAILFTMVHASYMYQQPFHHSFLFGIRSQKAKRTRSKQTNHTILLILNNNKKKWEQEQVLKKTK
jgi:hypothetical protein